VKLKAGDFPPILDIEKASPYGAENPRKGVLNWLKLGEEHYKVKPVIYWKKRKHWFFVTFGDVFNNYNEF